MKIEKGCSELREEFRCSKFGLHHDDPSLFIKPQCLKPKVHIIWVIFWVLYYIAMLGLDIYYNSDLAGEYFIYLTNWSYLLQALHVFVDCASTIHVHVKRKDIRDGIAVETPWYIKVVWVIFNMNNSISLIVTIVYYALLRPEFGHGSVNKHLMNSVYTLLNLVYCANPVKILHVYQPMIFGLFYLVFTIIYDALGYYPIYSILDWSKPGSAALVACMTLFIGIPVVHLVCFSIYTLRLFISSKSVCLGAYKTENGLVKREVTTRDVELEETAIKSTSASSNASNSVRPGS